MNTEEDFSLTDSLDVEIVMHRDAHFGGLFPEMIAYYRKGGKGVDENFTMKRIEELEKSEQQLGENIASTLLSGAQAEEIGHARSSYKKLRELYEMDEVSTSLPRMIADLILAEGEAEEEKKKVVAEGDVIVPLLLDLLKSENFYNPLFPGFGKAPFLAAECLGAIGDEKAAPALFECLERGDFFDEEAMLKALQMLGKPAKIFLLERICSRPVTKDHERAAMALSSFPPDPEIAKGSFALLKERGILEKLTLASYLIYACAGLKDKEDRKEFSNLDVPDELKPDVQVVFDGFS